MWTKQLLASERLRAHGLDCMTLLCRARLALLLGTLVSRQAQYGEESSKAHTPERRQAGARADHDDGQRRVGRQPEIWVLVHIHWHRVANLHRTSRCYKTHCVSRKPGTECDLNSRRSIACRRNYFAQRLTASWLGHERRLFHWQQSAIQKRGPQARLQALRGEGGGDADARPAQAHVAHHRHSHRDARRALQL